MPTDPLDRPALPIYLYRLARVKHLNPSALDQALYLIGLIPNRTAWRRFIDNLLLLLGTVLILSGIIFFFAYNWAKMSQLTKFGLLQLSLLIIAAFASQYGLERLAGQLALFATAILVGVLLAVFGQVYQTGADAFELFLTWAILITPWVLIGQFAPLWLLLLALFNLSLIFYWNQVIDYDKYSFYSTPLYLLLFILNGTALAAWEYAHQQGIAWLQGDWLGRILFIITLTTLIIPTLYAIVELEWEPLLRSVTVILYVIVTLFSLWYYRHQRHDLLLLAVCLLGILMTVTTLIGRLLPLEIEITWLILAAIVIGQATLATQWLIIIAKNKQKEIE
jgi:uncharacterized membrane protein